MPVNVWLYAALTLPNGSVEFVVMLIVVTLIVNNRTATFGVPSLACTQERKEPSPDAVPLHCPPGGEKKSPGGVLPDIVRYAAPRSER